MKIESYIRDSFSVIGKEGSTEDGAGFIQRLWIDANAHFDQVQHLAKKNADGSLAGIWGVMTDFSRAFQPWEDFRHGLYLAGVECEDAAEAPEGWAKWAVPGYEYLSAEVEGDTTFSDMLRYMEENGIQLVGAVHDFTCHRTGKAYMLFPTRML